MKSLQEIQEEIGKWSNTQFGFNLSHDDTSLSYGAPLGSLPSLLGMVEEIGELCHAVIYKHQGRGYSDPIEHRKAKEDALADLLIFACDFAERENISLLGVLNTVWETVSKRRKESWQNDKAAEVNAKDLK